MFILKKKNIILLQCRYFNDRLENKKLANQIIILLKMHDIETITYFISQGVHIDKKKIIIINRAEKNVRSTCVMVFQLCHKI